MILKITIKDFNRFVTPFTLTDQDVERLFFDEADFYGIQESELEIIREEGEEFRPGYNFDEDELYENFEKMAKTFKEKTGLSAPGTDGTNYLFPDKEVSEAWEDFQYDWFGWERPKPKASDEDYVQCVKCPECQSINPVTEWSKRGWCPDCQKVLLG